jgi:hypothetical protein
LFEIPLPSDGFLFDLLEHGRQSALHKKNSGFVAPTPGWHISTFCGYWILLSIRNPYINRFTNHFSIHSYHLTLRKWCYTRLPHDFPLDPLISPFHFHFRTYKHDLAILTEWWRQRTAWWELLNAAHQIICIHASAMFIREITIIYANHFQWYIGVIVVFSTSLDKCLKVKVKWRNERV